MKNAIHPNQKQFFVKKGKNHVFGIDFALRESMDGAAAEVLFDDVWEAAIKPEILNGPLIHSDDVQLRVPSANQSYINPSAEHREFRLCGSLWIAQITSDRNDQLWIVPNRAFDTRAITATFKTQIERDVFDRLALDHGFEPQEYARRILTSYISIHSCEGQPNI